MLVGKRRRMLRYLERTDLERYRALVADSACARVIAGSRGGPRGSRCATRTAKRSRFDYKGRKVLLVFYPFDFSRVCSDQLSVYQEVKPRPRGEGRRDGRDQRRPHPTRIRPSARNSASIRPLLADFEPKGEVAKAYGSYLEPLAWPTARSC